MADQDTIQGMVVNEIASLGSDEKKYLRQAYPGIDFARCWILEAGREPAGSGKMFALFGGGAALLLFGLKLIFVPSK